MGTYLKKTAAIVAFLVSVTACNNNAETVSNIKFESAHSLALDATISKGIILTKATTEKEIKAEIKEQLMYSIGQLNGLGGGVDMNRLETTITSVQFPLNEEEKIIEFSSHLFVSWPRNLEIPETIALYLPSKGSYEGLNEFFAEFGSYEHSGKKCLAREAHDVSQSILWYYYRPEKNDCPITNTPAFTSDSIVTLSASLEISSENTENKFPEYDKVWEDDKLVVTAIFGKAEFESQSEWDAGVKGYSDTYYKIIQFFGAPSSSNLGPSQLPSIENNETHLLFETDKGTVDIQLFLVDDIKYVDATFRQKYNARTKISDFTSYSGHSGLGANIRALAKMGKVAPDHYQIFLINGCDTFAYVDNSLNKAHQEANPGTGLDKYVDIITNAMPAYFHAMARANMSVIKGLYNQTENYRQILVGFDAYQKAAVTGEQDNRWPMPFEEDDGEGL